jgi:thiol-disulfide isomerase/thioredoxin
MVRGFWRVSISSTLLGVLCLGLQPVLAAGDQAATGDDKEEEAAAPAETGDPQPEVDIYAVPEGTPAELLAFIQNLVSTPPADRSPEGVQQHRDKLIESAIAAASKVLASKEAAADEAAQGAEIKLQLLTIAVRAGIGGKEEQLAEFKESLRKDERIAVRAVVMQRDLLEQSAQWQQLDDQAKAKYADDFVGFLKLIALSREHGQLVQVAARMIGQEDKKAAEELINKSAAVFAASGDAEVASVAVRLEGLIRNMNLLGSEMPIEGQLLVGSSFDWSQYKGKVVLVDFWATWCGPCIAELPNVVENYNLFHAKGFEVVGISLDTDRLKVLEFVNDREVPWPILFSEDSAATGWEHPMAVRYGIEAIPAAILVGKDGKVISKEARGEELGKHLKELLGEPQPLKIAEPEAPNTIENEGDSKE